MFLFYIALTLFIHQMATIPEQRLPSTLENITRQDYSNVLSEFAKFDNCPRELLETFAKFIDPAKGKSFKADKVRTSVIAHEMCERLVVNGFLAALIAINHIRSKGNPQPTFYNELIATCVAKTTYFLAIHEKDDRRYKEFAKKRDNILFNFCFADPDPMLKYIVSHVPHMIVDDVPDHIKRIMLTDDRMLP